VAPPDAEPVHERVLDALGAEIVAGTHRPGTALTLDEVRTRFAVSRTAAREAMRILEHLALVTPRRRVGLVVRPRADWASLDPRVLRWRSAGPGAVTQRRAVAELREAVLPVAAAACARHATASEADRLGALVGAVRAATPPERRVAAHVELLGLVLTAARNELLAATAPAVLPSAADPGSAAALARRAVRDQHGALARAVAGRDPAAARAAMTAIVAAADALA
jgi:DNA-binding FadR family transcriptional regulator